MKIDDSTELKKIIIKDVVVDKEEVLFERGGSRSFL